MYIQQRERMSKNKRKVLTVEWSIDKRKQQKRTNRLSLLALHNQSKTKYKYLHNDYIRRKKELIMMEPAV